MAVLYGNYAGDNMNVKMARRMVQADGIKVETVIANDDVASAAKTEREKRRGVAGEILMWKVAGLHWHFLGGSDRDRAEGNRFHLQHRHRSDLLRDTRGRQTQLSDRTLQDGGRHRSPWGTRGKVDDLKSADEMAQIALDYILPDLPFDSGDEVVVMVSGSGATPIMELYIVYRKLVELLGKSGVTIYRPYVGNYFTSLDMMGVTVTVMKLDAELKKLIAAEASLIGLTQLNSPNPHQTKCPPIPPPKAASFFLKRSTPMAPTSAKLTGPPEMATMAST